MARTIRTNSAAGGVVSSAAGLSTSEVQALIDTTVNSKVQWQLESYTEYSSISGAGFYPFLASIDFENVYAYHVTMRGFAPASGAARMRLRLENGGTQITGNSNVNYFGQYGASLQTSNTTFSNGDWYPANPNANDSFNQGLNTKEFTFYFNKDGTGTNPKRRFDCEYLSFIPIEGGYTSYAHIQKITVNASADFDGISFDMAGNSWQSNLSQMYCTPSVTVYKQLRVPAT